MKKISLKIAAGVFFFYLVRDLLLYVLLPLFIFKQSGF